MVIRMITSTANNKVKRIMSLRDKSKERRKEGVFIVEGIKMFNEAPRPWIKEVYVSETFMNKCDDEMRSLIESVKHEVFSDEVFRKTSDTQTPQGILSVLKMPHYELTDYINNNTKGDKGGFFILLEDLQDPGNLGTILRAGEGAGVSGIIMSKNTADIFNPKVIRSTMGSIYRVPFFTSDNLCETIDMLKDNGISVYAAHLDKSVDYDKVDCTKPVAFLIGNESSGLKRETADQATGYIKIPMSGQVESLNAAIATSILMYEAARQRRVKKI
jgi:TrmH family RNA methyltransferase